MRRKVLGIVGINVLLLCAACSGEDGDDGSNGASSAVRQSDEPAGVNCENGGTKIEFGESDTEGELAEDSISGTSYVCNGVAGSSIEAEVVEPGDANCPAGGTKLTAGDDVLYVCNGVEAGGPTGPT